MTSASIIAPKVLYWFVKQSAVAPIPLGFIRDNRGGVLVIGGATGSHMTGHKDTWWDKFRDVVLQGYIPSELAKAQNIISPDWTPPSLDDKDSLIVRRIQEDKI